MSPKLALLGGIPIRTKSSPSWPVLGETEEKLLLRVLHLGKWGRLNGPEVTEFEQRFAAAHAGKHGVAMVNGTVTQPRSVKKQIQYL